MKISGRQLLPVDPAVLWSILHDPLALKDVLPGCESLEAIGSDEFRVALTLRIGPITDRFTGLLKLNQVNVLSDLDFQAEGESPNGLVSCRGRFLLETDAGVDTALCYEADIEVGGRLAQMSPRLLETTARSFARRCQEGLEKQVAMRTRVYTTTTAPPPGPPQLQPSPMDPRHWLRRAVFWVVISLGVISISRVLERRRVKLVAKQVIDALEQPERSESPTG